MRAFALGLALVALVPLAGCDPEQGFLPSGFVDPAAFAARQDDFLAYAIGSVNWTGTVSQPNGVRRSAYRTP